MVGPTHISQAGSKIFQFPGIPPGLFGHTDYQDHSLTLSPGDSVLFCSDGIADARNLLGDEFGIDRLASICDRGNLPSAAGLLVRIFSAVNDFSRGADQHDDMAAALLYCAG
jgi:sigma-B regulation protein RsbU (phosphoserine phosphatase)